MLRIATEARFYLGVPGMHAVGFLWCIHPDIAALHVSHLALGLQEQEIQICRVERARTHSVHIPRLRALNIAGAAICLSWMRISRGIHNVAHPNKCNSSFHRLYCFIYLSLHLEQEGDNKEIGSPINAVFSAKN